MSPDTPIQPRNVKDIIKLAGQRAENLYKNHKLCCSESLLLVLNHGFSGGLSSETVKQLGAGFCGGMNAGCTCGALSGAIMGFGLLVGPHTKKGLSKKKFRKLSKKMHDRFHESFSSTCCRILIKPFDKDKKGRTQYCKGLTETTAEIAVSILLEAAPGMIKQADMDFLASRDSMIAGFMKSLG
jgi:C_GCAxxG_C_C family probable redox protein